jgi:hypothetical protein
MKRQEQDRKPFDQATRSHPPRYKGPGRRSNGCRHWRIRMNQEGKITVGWIGESARRREQRYKSVHSFDLSFTARAGEMGGYNIGGIL